jgi:hypothetical protein
VRRSSSPAAGQRAALVHEQLQRKALDGIAGVLHAPLEGAPPWYAPAALIEVPDEFDLRLVDGPPAYAAGPRRAGAPALPRLRERLVAGAAVALDDIARPGEREVLAVWKLSTDWRFALDERAGLAIGAAPTTPAQPRSTGAPRRPRRTRRGSRAAHRHRPPSPATTINL